MDYIYTLIIPHYNIPNLLKRLLSTIPRRKDLQVIVVDDCSSKNYESLEIIKEEYDWVEWYSTGTNGGGGKARNIGLKHALGKYILFADADDFFTPGISSILDKYKSEDFDMVIFQAISLHSESYQIDSRSTLLDHWINLYKKDIKKGSDKLKFYFGEPWCKIIRHKLIKENNIRFDEIKCHNDTKFSYLIGYYTSKLHVEPKVGYVITFRNNSVVNTNYKDRYEIEVNVFSEKQQFFLDHNLKHIANDLYVPVVHDLVRGHFRAFLKKYRVIKNMNPHFPLNKLILQQIYIAIKQKLGMTY